MHCLSLPQALVGPGLIERLSIGLALYRIFLFNASNRRNADHHVLSILGFIGNSHIKQRDSYSNFGLGIVTNEGCMLE